MKNAGTILKTTAPVDISSAKSSRKTFATTKKRRQGRHPLSARAERLSCISATPGDLASTSRRRAENNGYLQPPLRRLNHPTKEDTEYVGVDHRRRQMARFDFGEHHLYYASDYFERMYECAEILIQKRTRLRLANISPHDWDEYRGTLNVPGRESPGRAPSVEENLDLFGGCAPGEFEDGAKVLRARIDMASPNIHMRDPVIYTDPPRPPFPPRRQVVASTDVRLRASARIRLRGGDPLVLHARVRDSPPALRLGAPGAGVS
jgi:hypothetical protein